MKNAILAFIFSLFLDLPMFAQYRALCIHFDEPSIQWRIPPVKVDFVCKQVHELMLQANGIRAKNHLSKQRLYEIIVETGRREELSEGDTFGSVMPALFEGPSPENGYRLILRESDFQLSEVEILVLLCSQFADILYDDNLPLWSWAGGHWYKVLSEKDEAGNFRKDCLGYFELGNFLGKPLRNPLMFAREMFVNTFSLLSLAKSGYLDPSIIRPPSIQSQRYWHDLGIDFKPFNLRASPEVSW